jgi:DNA-directed RNA polymerase beta' subunit
LQADFDGDQAAVFLPLTDNAQREAGERLSVAGHLTRTPDLLKDLVPNNEALWGLAELSLTQEGRREIAEMLGTAVATSGAIVTRTTLEEALHLVSQRDGIHRILEVLETLMQRGFEVTRASGASINPFVGSHFSLPVAPEGNDSKAWDLYRQEVSEWLAANIDYVDADLGAQLLAVKSGSWGEIQQLVGLLSTQGAVKDIQDRQIPVRHGYRDGLQPAEIYALAVGARESFARIQQEWRQIELEIRKRSITKSFSVLARAMRAEQPGIVFAHAASIGEVDPLTDPDSRLFVGLPI